MVNWVTCLYAGKGSLQAEVLPFKRVLFDELLVNELLLVFLLLALHRRTV